MFTSSVRHLLSAPAARIATQQCYMSSRNVINALYQPGMKFKKCNTNITPNTCTRTPCICLSTPESQKKIDDVLAKYDDTLNYSKEQISEATKNNVLFTWGPSDVMGASAIQIEKGDGIYFYDTDGKKYIDWNAMAMCSNLGHTMPQSVKKAINEQMDSMPYMYPGISISPIRAKLCALLSDIFPGDINQFLFPTGGAEANEVAVRIARVFTGKHKIISGYRSYHGSTTVTAALTGDPRRWPAEAGATGILKSFGPFPYSFSWGSSPEEITQNYITHLKEQIAYEGPNTIAAIWLESVVGTNGILKPPPGYLEAIREICTEHNILMVCDEVMAGWGRTGKLFGFCHAPSVVPDIVTFAKGVNGAYVPLGGVGLRDRIAHYFRENPIHTGATYNGHPIGLASAYAVIKEMLSRNIVQHVANMEPHMIKGLQYLADRHPSVKQGRVVGLFACMDIQKNSKTGEFIAAVHDPLPKAMVEFKQELLKNGLFTMIRGHTVHCNPPLIITPDQIDEGISILDKCLPILDNAMEE